MEVATRRGPSCYFITLLVKYFILTASDILTGRETGTYDYLEIAGMTLGCATPSFLFFWERCGMACVIRLAYTGIFSRSFA